MHRICMDARNLHGRTEFAWSHGICMDARNLYGHTEFAWTHKICMDARNMHGRRTEIGQSGGASQWRVCNLRGLSRLFFINIDYAQDRQVFKIALTGLNTEFTNFGLYFKSGQDKVSRK